MSVPEEGAERSDPQALREEARQRLRQRCPADLASLGTGDLRVLIHELEVHQVELEVQNEDLRRAQAELAEARNRYADLYEFAPVGYLTLDREGVIRQANLAIEHLCGAVRGQLLGRRFESLVAKEDRDACYIFLRESASLEGVHAREFLLARPDGRTQWVNATASALRAAGEQADGFRVALSDITERKQAEEALRQSERRLKELAATLEQRVAERTAQLQGLAVQLSQSEQRERHRLARILHDNLQQLLVGAKLALSVLRRNVTDEVLAQCVEQVNELLDQSVAISRSLTVELSPPILYEGTMRQVLEWLARWMYDKHGLSVQLEVDEAANVQMEEFRLLVFGIVRELLLNIVKHARVTAATVRMTQDDGNRVRVVVADEGVGFDPQGARLTEESGFGLLGIRQRLTAIGGQIDVDSAPGKGTRISLVAPTQVQPAAAAKQAQPDGLPSSPPPRAVHWPLKAGSGGRPAKVRVLLADDHAVVRDGLARLLQVQPGIDVVGGASDGQQVLEMALQLRPDVVVMDVSMPRLSGMEATRRILAELPGTRVIGLSMHTDPDIAAAMRKAGAVAYLAKSAQPDVLVARIRQCAAQSVDGQGE